MNILVDKITKMKNFIKLESFLNKYNGLIKVSGLQGSNKSFITAAIFEKIKGNLIYVCANELEAKNKYEELVKIAGEDIVYSLPAKDIFFYSSEARSRDVQAERMKLILNLITSNKKKIIVLSSEALLDKISKKEVFKDYVIKVNTSSTFDIREIEEKLIYMGYEKTTEVNHEGEYSIRGGICDIYPFMAEDPARIELWGDDIESIRKFDSETQRSQENISELTIYPFKDILFGEEKIQYAREKIVKERTRDLMHSNSYDRIFDELEKVNAIYYPEKYLNLMFNDDEVISILDYFDTENDVIIVDELRKIEQKCIIEEDLFLEYIKEEIEKGKMTHIQGNLRYSFDDVKYELENFRLIAMSMFDTEGFIAPKEKVIFNIRQIDSNIRNINVFKENIEKYMKEDYIPIIFAGTSAGLNNLKDELLLDGYTIKVIDIDNSNTPKFEEGIIYLTRGGFKEGFIIEDLNLVIYSAEEILTAKRRTIKRKKKGKAIESFADLKEGDFIVHENHGIGIYRGVESVEIFDTAKDCIKIEYADDSLLYVAIENLNMVQKYIGNDANPPKINKLNGKEWIKAKAKAQASVRETAEKLVKLYAQRASVKGYMFRPDNDWQNQFEDEFPYIETNDQLIAIEEVKKDMESEKVMDRLLCGDVGFGKTEVAIRAAFKAVQDGKQVAVLAPTTILVEQHYKTFKERMKNFPIDIEYVSRFRTPKQVKEAFEGIKKGRVDIIIGTHKLLAESLEFKDLGLIVLDEEQRFGVKQKELLKSKSLNVDTLAMSATPIPRTLHMSLSGIRDISILEEAPKERKPVQTYVIEKNDGLIKNAIYKEVGRGGQVFYLYNRVQGLSTLTDELRKIMPDVHFEYAHGTMKKSEMEAVMKDFVDGKIDVLVSTTIIETGIDIPNVNTMLIDDADKMGLSQLYQLKGRVGRKSRSAYCYFMYEEGKMVSEVADKRLAALKEFTELGAGLKIAMRDLEIRGAGNLLGSEQHGHLASVGYDMYCKLLEDAICEMKGEKVEKRCEVRISLNINAYIAEDYIADSFTKVEIYKRIASIENEEDLKELVDETSERFGKVPKYTLNLFYIALLKAYVKNINVKQISENDDEVKFTLEDDAELSEKEAKNLMDIIIKNSRVRMTTTKEKAIIYKKTKEDSKDALHLLNHLIALIKAIIEDGEYKDGDKDGENINEREEKNESTISIRRRSWTKRINQ